MKEVIIKDKDLQAAAADGMDAFVDLVVNATLKTIGGTLNADNMAALNADQITLLAYHYLREEVMDGGFVQLIHNGLGAFIYLNPTAKAFREWGLQDLYRILNKSHSKYMKYRADLERDCDDAAFMALYEKYPEFDDFDDAFIEGEEGFTRQIAHYIDAHIENFVVIEK